MMTQSANTFNVLFLIRKSRIQNNGEVPIALRITVNGQRAEVNIKRSIDPGKWDQNKGRCTGNTFASAELNKYIETVRAKVYMIHRQLEMDGEHITAREIADIYMGKRDELKNKTIIGLYSEHNAEVLSLVGKSFVKATALKFDTSLQHLQNFIKSHSGQLDISLTRVTPDFIRKFDVFLKTDCGCHHNTALKHHKNLKKIIRIAMANGWITKDPYFSFSFKELPTNIEFLTREELNRIMELDLPQGSSIEQVRDIFVFCAFTGLAYIDVKTLKDKHIFTDNDGDKWIRKKRQKTGVLCEIPLMSISQQLLDKYKEHPLCVPAQTKLPVFSNIVMNDYLGQIGSMAGITKPVTCHVARHTCATSVLLANGVPIQDVAKILGHKSVKMTERYAKVLNLTLKNDMKMVDKIFGKLI